MASTLIRHALPAPPAISPLTIAMIEAPFQAFLVPAVGLPALSTARFLPTAVAAIAMTSVTAAANPKQTTAPGGTANAQPENDEAIGHGPVPAELDNSPGSGQVTIKAVVVLHLATGLPRSDLDRFKRSRSSPPGKPQDDTPTCQEKNGAALFKRG